MHAPQIIYVILIGMNLGTALTKDGEPKSGTHDFVRSLIAAAMIFGLLWWGGFFSGGH
jgi:hypothetical protein